MNDTTTLGALGNAIFTVAVFGGVTALLAACGGVIGETYKRTSRQESSAPQPFVLAFLGALVEVFIQRPLRLHRSRMEVVRRMEAARAEALAEAIDAAALRHPANYRARMAAMAAHPAGTAAAQDQDQAPVAVGGTSLHLVGEGAHLRSVPTWDGGDAA